MIKSPSINTLVNKFDEIIDIATKNKFLINFDELQIENKNIIGEGSFSLVNKCKWRGLEIVIKKPRTINNLNTFEFLNEIEIWNTIKHPNIAQFLGIAIDKGTILIMMERVNGITLKTMLRISPMRLYRNKLSYIKQLAQVINFLHKCNPPIIYRDLKLDNIMVNKDNKLYLIDFGLSRFINKNIKDYKMTGVTGTLLFMAPEVLLSNNYDLKADIYSFGIVCYIIVKRYYPFICNNYEDYLIYKKSFNPVIHNKYYRNLIKKCIEFDVDSRFNIDDVITYLHL